MGLCCCGGAARIDETKVKPFSKEDGDLTQGPVKERRCTDWICIIIFLLHWVAFIIVVLAGIQKGNPTKLYSPRDYQGAYCGVKDQWNNGPNLKDQPALFYTMNVSAMVQPIALKLVCSSAAASYLQTTLSSVNYTQYECSCCLRPCANYTCPGAIKQVDYTDPSLLGNIVGGQMSELTGGGAGLFSANTLNPGLVSDTFQQATKNFNMACTTKCTAYDQINATDRRNYTYMPAPDVGLRSAWMQLVNGNGVPSGIEDAIQTSFTFTALPYRVCPYPESKCVPMPGLTFKEMIPNYCQFQISGNAQAALGSAASSALEGLANTGFTENAGETVGTWIGQLLNCFWALVVTCFVALVIGLIFMVLLRFLVGVMVYLSLFLVFVMLVIGGGVLLLRSHQCKGSSITSSAQVTGNAAVSTVNVLAQAAVKGTGNPLAGETFTGDGNDYRGKQTKTISGYTCQTWDCSLDNSCTNNQSLFTSAKYPELQSNYARNPRNPKYVAYTIWCYTTDPVVKWEIALPVGVLYPECTNGYEVDGWQARKALEILGYICWGISFFWLLLCFCLFRRIRLAIAINKVAAMFVYETPYILLVPIVEVIIGLIWCLLWALAATFLVSQVPDSRTPMRAYSSYAEAYGYYSDDGKTWNIGKCLGSWPQGSVWKDDDTCDETGAQPACWRCYPPRFVFDFRFPYIFFTFLWTNAFGIACAQVIVAGAVGIWFFTPHSEKRKVGKVRRAIWNLFRYHLGSVMFGSFILAVVQFIRYSLMYFEQQAKVQKNKVMVIVLKVAQCCIWCLEKCIKFLNKNAYIQVALMGTNFCSSAKVGFSLVLRNAIRFGVVAGLGWIINLIGFMIITCATTFAGYFILKGMYPDANPIIPMIFFIISGYLCSKLFMAVFELAVDTSLQAYIIVEEYGGEASNPDEQYVPGPLKSLVPSKG